MQRSIRYGDVEIGFTIRFMTGGRRRVAINVLPNGDVCVAAPDFATPDDVVAAVRRRARWVWQQLEACKVRQRLVLPRHYVSGESHIYLGRRHVLKVFVDATRPPSVRLWRGKLEVVSSRSAPEEVAALLDRWYRERASEYLSRLIEEMTADIRWLNAPPAFRLLRMKTQWGSCSPTGTLILNPDLVKVPRPCVEYVIAHELCHLREHNHSVRYFELLSGVMPDWAKRKAELDVLAELALNR
ncbi:SprT family zinc-dependent metalloprotease [Accumulibacter sp.]|uniref:M48 family metallopeptidase n=1 Tax=Accumulibacter sp. TaxID=2053492 RepID=UPI001A601F17|nr:SprT family zinc-dependent metalloprotease [Accumulibacter sp.]MBL8374000.1 M48 family metallopeptidase [Accumulibacter sp.]